MKFFDQNSAPAISGNLANYTFRFPTQGRSSLENQSRDQKDTVFKACKLEPYIQISLYAKTD